MSTEQTPEDIGYKAAPTPKLDADHLTVLRAYELGKTPDTTRMRYRIALSMVGAWGLIFRDRTALTPAGERALAEHRARGGR